MYTRIINKPKGNNIPFTTHIYIYLLSSEVHPLRMITSSSSSLSESLTVGVGTNT